MTDQKNSNQVVRELKWLDVKEPDPYLLNVRELRGRNVNTELHTPSIRQSAPGPIHAQSTVQNLEKNIWLPLPISESIPALVSTILPQCISDLDTDQGEIINEILQNIAQTLNQMLLMTTTGNPTNNLDSNKILHDNTLDRQSAPTLNASDVQKQTITSTKDTYKSNSSKHIHTNSITNFEKKKQNKLLWT